MPFILLLFFICVPIAEIAVFIRVGDAIGLLPTLMTVILTAVIGTWLLQRQGMAAFARTQTALAEGRVPVDSVVDGVCLLVAGAFLLTPGIITDAIGFLLFVPPVRRFLATTIFKRMINGMNIHVESGAPSAGRAPGSEGHQSNNRRPPPGDGPVIDGEFERVEPEESGGASNESPWRNNRTNNSTR